MDVLGYGRVSKLDYGRKVSDEELDIAAKQQRNRLERAGCTEIFFDIQRGTDDDRPDFERLLARMRSKSQCDRVVITRDDRITRNATMTLELIDIFVTQQIELLVLDDGLEVVDFSNPYEWKKRVQAGVDSQFEVKMLGLRIRRGYEYLRSQKKASPAVPFGYQRSSDGKYESNPDQWEIAQAIVNAFFRYRTLRKTCKLVADLTGKEWRASTMRHWLTNEVLRGNTPYRIDPKTRRPQEIAYGTHPDAVLITPDQDMLLRQILDENRRLGGVRNRLPYPLGSGLCKCRHCGSSMTIAKIDRSSEDLQYWLRCNSAQNLNNRCSFRGTPHSSFVELHVIEALVSKAEEIANQVETVTLQKQDSPELISLKNQYAHLCSIPGKNPAIEKAKQDLEEQMRNLESLTQQQKTQSSYDGTAFKALIDVYKKKTYWMSLEPEERRERFRQFVKTVWISVEKTGKVNQYLVQVELKF